MEFLYLVVGLATLIVSVLGYEHEVKYSALQQMLINPTEKWTAGAALSNSRSGQKTFVILVALFILVTWLSLPPFQILLAILTLMELGYLWQIDKNFQPERMAYVIVCESWIPGLAEYIAVTAAYSTYDDSIIYWQAVKRIVSADHRLLPRAYQLEALLGCQINFR